MADAATVSGLAVVALLLVGSVVVPFVASRRGLPGDRNRRRITRATYAVVAVVAVLLGVGGSAVPVLLAAVAANIAFGERENIPFSRYPMFARPAPMSWFIRIEGADGVALRPPRELGLTSSAIRKRYAAEIEHLTGRPGASLRASDREHDEAGARLLAYLREVGDEVSGPMRVVRVEMAAGDDGLAVTERVVARDE